MAADTSQAERELLDALSPAEWENVCEAIAQGEAPNEVVKALGVKRIVFQRWLDEHPDKAADFKSAKRLRAEAQ